MLSTHYNRDIKWLFICVILSISTHSIAQKMTIWASYSQSKYIYSPGIEGAYFFNKKWGLEFGLNAAIQSYEKEKISNVSDDRKINPFQNGNLGFTRLLIKNKKDKLYIVLGCKYYLGSNFEKLHYYENGDYYIYYDTMKNRVKLGLDSGLAFTHNETSFLLKYDHIYQRIRIGIGYTF